MNLELQYDNIETNMSAILLTFFLPYPLPISSQTGLPHHKQCPSPSLANVSWSLVLLGAQTHGR